MLDKIQQLTAKQIIVIVAIILLLILLLPKLIRYYTNQIKGASDSFAANKQERNTDAVEKAKEEIDKNSLTYSHSEYVQMADKIVSAFSGWGTDLDKLTEVFSKLETKSDFLKLVEVYGLREYYSESVFWFTFSGNLYQALANELDDSERQAVNQALSQTGITI